MSETELTTDRRHLTRDGWDSMGDTPPGASADTRQRDVPTGRGEARLELGSTAELELRSRRSEN